MNTYIYDKEATKHFLQMFYYIWENESMVRDIKEELEQIRKVK